jgi:AcrR family transcriptional regulator
MKRIVDLPARRYRSEVRAAQVADTRRRILEATLRVMARGVASVSVPAVAREAGVSVPTVYRHFRTKADLMAALYPHVERRAGRDEIAPPRSLDEARVTVRAVFAHVDSLDDLARAAVASPAAEEARRAMMPARVERVSRVVDAIAPELGSSERERLTRLLVILTSSSALRLWRDHLNASVDDAADDVDWVLRACVANAAAGAA